MNGGGEDFDVLRGVLGDVLRAGVERSLPDENFDDLALRAFRFQARENPLYAAFCEGRGVDPARIECWQEVPAVPTRAFKHFRILSGTNASVEAVFRTSGTSAGRERRGEHPVRSLALYREAALPNFAAHLLPEGRRLPLVSLIPSPEAVPDSSLSRMTGMVDETLASPGGGWFVDPDSGIRVAELEEVLRGFDASGEPVLLMATAYALVHWLDAMDRSGWRFTLPPGTRIMETGGFKGRSRSMERSELYDALREKLGVPPAFVVNEYGMTELLSQFYEPVLPGAPGVREELQGGDPLLERRHVGPPWVRTRVLDPETLEPVRRGEPGILHHFDLANLGSVCSVLTEDFGVETDGGFRVLGRAPGAEPRGCSRAMDELLSRERPGEVGRR